MSVLALSFGGTVRATTSAPSSSPSPSSNAYIDTPQSSVTTVTTYPSYSSSWDSWSGGSNYTRWPSYSSSTYTWVPRRYFFPPTPPALGEPYLKNRTKSASLSRSSIPLALSDYVNEPFYAPLSPFLYEEHVSKKRQKMLDDYHEAKLALTAELHAKLESLESSDAATREAQLAEFARYQTPRIAAVEKQASDIREDLTHGGLFSDTSDWNEGRTWHLGDNTRYESTLDEAKVMRGAAFFQEGLSPEQRRLLREYAMQLDDSARGPSADVSLASRGPYFYFSPEMTRIRLPANLPPELEAKINTYRQQKSAIMKELRDVLYREDRRWFDWTRVRALRELADRQAPQIAALEPLADEIRRGLVKFPNPAEPGTMSKVLPGDLGTRIANYMKRRTVLTTTLNNKANDLKKQFPSSRVEFVRMNGGFGILFVPDRRLSATDKAQAETARTQLSPFNDEQTNAFVALVREKEAIRDTLVKAAGPIGPIVTPRIVDLILSEYAGVLQQQELWQQYHDYEVAVLQPGLSPEQRRLLFDACLLKLDQQLPYYTY
jgi:hypothetical protein